MTKLGKAQVQTLSNSFFDIKLKNVLMMKNQNREFLTQKMETKKSSIM